MTIEHIFYMRDSSTKLMAWRTSGPVGTAFGIADDLRSARSDARDAVRELADGATPDPIREYLERHHSLGIILRSRIDNAHDYDMRELTVDILSYTLGYNDARKPIDVAGWGFESVYGTPVILAAMPYDPLGEVLGQLEPTESMGLALGFRDVGNQVQASWLSGVAREGAQEAGSNRVQTLAAAGLTLHSTVGDLMALSGLSREKLLAGVVDQSERRSLILA